MEPLISFVVPSYNYARFLPDCLMGIFNQEGGFAFEIIIINDASTDNTDQIVRSITDPRVRVINHAINQGHATTIEEGLRQAHGKYIARIDPDDRYRPYFLLETSQSLTTGATSPLTDVT